MPTNKKALIRYKYLDKLLSDPFHYYDRKTSCEMVNNLPDYSLCKLSKKTIENDINDLKEYPFNAPPTRPKKCLPR